MGKQILVIFVASDFTGQPLDFIICQNSGYKINAKKVSIAKDNRYRWKAHDFTSSEFESG